VRVASVEIPYSIAAALPSLAVIDITNEVAREVAHAGAEQGIVFISTMCEHPCLVRVNERESGFFEDLAALLDRLVPLETCERERLLSFLLGPRSEAVPFAEGRLCLGQWQRILVLGFDESSRYDWEITIVG
jgi:thiamine phosphate synthase YjbQ (UPF0047 family)